MRLFAIISSLYGSLCVFDSSAAEQILSILPLELYNLSISFGLASAADLSVSIVDMFFINKKIYIY